MVIMISSSKIKEIAYLITRFMVTILSVRMFQIIYPNITSKDGITFVIKDLDIQTITMQKKCIMRMAANHVIIQVEKLF